VSRRSALQLCAEVGMRVDADRADPAEVEAALTWTAGRSTRPH
jgi:hypothetical protein